MSCTGSSDCACGCCAGTSVQTPQMETNPPGQPSISYRAGTWATFNESMLARLSSSDYPALANLKTRDDDDFTVAFLDATSVVLDILTFYQERLANESYLRTAVQLRSLTELSRLIGYQPAPGIAASTYLAFTLKSAPGLPPNPSTLAITIPTGTQVQSVPAQNQPPRTFETIADISAKADWNALQVQTGLPWTPIIGDTSIYLSGTSTQLQPGDLILIVGDERAVPSGSNTANNNWDIRQVTTVTADTQNNRTYVAWGAEGLGDASTHVNPAQVNPKFYAFRQRAALFGYNAANTMMLDTNNTLLGNLINTYDDILGIPIYSEWKNFSLTNSIDLDALYPKVVTGSWLALILPDAQTTRTPAGFINLYHANSVSPVSRSDYGLSAKITRVFPDTTANLGSYLLRQTIALAQSEELVVAEQPLDHPLYGTQLDLEDLRPDLVGATIVALSGVGQKVSLNAGVSNIEFVPDDVTASSVSLNPGDTFTLTDPTPLPLDSTGAIPNWKTSTTPTTLKAQDENGRTGTVQGKSGVQLFVSQFSLVPASNSDPEIGEYALVSSVIGLLTPYPHTQIQLRSPLTNCYNRAATTVNVNVAPATHGTTVTEIMGNGSAATPNQNFTLKQSPLTYVQAATPTGSQSTLQVRANGVAWNGVASLYERGPSSQVFATVGQSDGTTDVFFGDGIEGATLPTGQNNIQATYRIGSGSAGNVAAGTLTTLIQRPLGVSGVANPEPATGGQDAQSINDVRAHAPQTVLTLERAVSITDYQNYASTFAGIEKAYAIWIPSGPSRGIFLTVAAVGGAALSASNPTLTNLITSLQNYGNPLIPITAQSFVETLFGLTADVAYDPAYETPTVQAQILQTLSQAYSFAERTFGQGVTADEISTFIQGVPGVTAVNVTGISIVASSEGGDLASLSGGFTVSNWNSWMSQQVTVPRPYSDSPSRICPYLPLANAQSSPLPAEILVLDPNPGSVVLGVML